MSEEIHEKKWTLWVLCILLVLLTLISRILVAYYLASDAPGDGVVYARIARNVLEQGVYSTDAESPFSPTLIRMPGYPLFLAAVYSLAGHENNTAVRITQAVFDTATCVLIALIAFLWTDDEERKRRNAFWAFILAMLCPFIVIYAGTILTETLTTFLMAAMILTATIAFRSASIGREVAWWSLTGLLAGLAVLLRPDSGLFAAAIGTAIVVTCLFIRSADPVPYRSRIFGAFWRGGTFSLVFALVLVPWTIRNQRVFGMIQPLSPAHSEMPGEFVPYGYQRWLRTWIDDFRFIEPMLWELGSKPININNIPARTFDSAEERDRVAALLAQYSHPPGSVSNDSTADETDNETADTETDESADSDDSNDESADDNSTADESNSDTSDDDENKKYDVRMTPEIDAAFAEIAAERVDRRPFRYYFFLPVKRAAALWFDSHSLYYPFGGQMSPIQDMDYDENQQYWLPAFTLLMWIYTGLGFGGVVAFWRGRTDRESLKWLLLAALMFVPRIAFFSTLENPEPRYVVELFVFTAIFGGILLGGLRFRREPEEEPVEPRPLPERLVSLDVFRGVTIAAMVLVNAPGSWKAVYSQLAHAAWNGATLADAVFPAFLFIVGISITISLGGRKDKGDVGTSIYLKIVKRSVLLFLIGLAVEIFPFYNIWTGAWVEPSTMRVMGVLQRIAICYVIASLMFLHTNWRRQLAVTGLILIGYAALLSWVNVPGCAETSILDKTCNLAAYVDRIVLTTDHIWSETRVFDPEGLLSTLGAIVTTLAGVLTGQWLRSERSANRKAAVMIAAGILLTIGGYVWSIWLPLNKSLWTSSFAVFESGLSLIFFGLCYWLIDLKGYRRLTTPFAILGSNAIALYVGSSLMGTALTVIQIEGANDKTFSLQEAIFNRFFVPYASPVNASLLFAVAFVLIWLLVLWLLYRKGVFIKI